MGKTGWISVDDLRDLDEFRAFLNDGSSSNSLAQHLRPRLSKITIDNLSQSDIGRDFGELLAKDLNSVIVAGPLYSPATFANVPLSARTQSLIQVRMRGDSLYAFNRRLLAESLPQFIEYSKPQQLLDSYWERQDEDSFADILKELNPVILTLLRFLGCTDQNEAADIRQEVLIGLARYFPRFRGRHEKQLKSLVYTFTHRRFVEWLRRKKRRREESKAPEALVADADRAKQDESLPAQTRIDLEFANKILSALPENQRSILYLRFRDDYSFKEIGT